MEVIIASTEIRWGISVSQSGGGEFQAGPALADLGSCCGLNFNCAQGLGGER